MKTSVEIKYSPPNHWCYAKWYVLASYNGHEEVHLGFIKKPSKRKAQKCLKETIKRMKCFERFYT